MDFGQFFSRAAQAGAGIRSAEEAERIARQNQLAIEQQNRQRAMADAMSRQQIASRAAGLAPPTIGAFAPGQAFGTPEVPAPAAPAPVPGQVALPTGVQPSQAGAGRGMVNPPLIGQPQPVPSGPGVTPAPAAGLQIPSAAPEATSPFGRFMAQERRTLGEQYKRNALYEQVVDKYRLAASPLGVFKSQTDAQREQAKQILSRVNELTADELQYVLDKGELPPAKPMADKPTTPAKPTAPAAKPSQYDKPTPYDALIQQSAQQYGIDPAVFKRLIGTESSFNPAAVSPRGESFGLGIAQIADVHGLTREQKLDPNTAILFAAQLFSQYIQASGGNVQEALMRYKGATSAQGRAAMQKPINEILGGAAPTAATTITPGASPAKTADAVAAVVKPLPPAKGGTMYGSAAIDATVNNPQIQQVLSQRQALVDQIQLMEQYGFGMQAMELVPQIKAIDLGLYKAQADQGIYEGTTMGNFSRAMQMLSHFRGVPHQVLDRGDRTYDLYVGGQVAQTGLSIETLADLIRSNVDEEYRSQRQQLVAKRAEKAEDRAAKIDEIVATEMLKSQSNLNVAMINATAELKKQNIINQKAQLQVDSNTGQVILYEGGKITVINPAATEEIRGQTVQRPTAIPVARLP